MIADSAPWTGPTKGVSVVEYDNSSIIGANNHIKSTNGVSIIGNSTERERGKMPFRTGAPRAKSVTGMICHSSSSTSHHLVHIGYAATGGPAEHDGLR